MLNPLPLILLPLTTAAAIPLSSLSTNATSLLQPWQITTLSTHSPSGYPANHPYSSLRFSITDPNTITLGATHFGDAAFAPSQANCSVWWLGPTENPRDERWTSTCADAAPAMQGKWTFQVVGGSGGEGAQNSVTTDFGLRVVLEEAVVLGTGGVVQLRFEGEAKFRRGGGVGKGGGRGESAPVVVQQKLVEMRCVAGDCEEVV
ncbi:hypothetical protein C8A00DRAFT_32280 [Chaetomidium leptoderma]|uniref:Uncharacterized protein n=1 Tax=Chaetomidium leptoderma TaxID=669021 RepID=A0AAN6VNM3_9PEZI|nr:hypothetical protein C8A00DRAFT_32280 [Chaetomidium leptoderma]